MLFPLLCIELYWREVATESTGPITAQLTLSLTLILPKTMKKVILKWKWGREENNASLLLRDFLL